MGLLDDAIREHLELKRSRGADPHEVAREEQEALQPIGLGELPAWALGPAQLEPIALTPAEEAWAAEQVPPPEAEMLVVGEALPLGQAEPAIYGPGALASSLESELAGADQATMEIDMAALLGEPEGLAGLGGEGEEIPGADITVRRIAQQGALEFEAADLEWEDVPRRRDGSAEPESAPPSRLAFE